MKNLKYFVGVLALAALAMTSCDPVVPPVDPPVDPPVEKEEAPAIADPAAGKVIIAVRVPDGTCNGIVARGKNGAELGNDFDTDVPFTLVEGKTTWHQLELTYATDMAVKVLAKPEIETVDWGTQWGTQWGMNVEGETPNVTFVAETTAEFTLEYGGEVKLINCPDGGVVYIDVVAWKSAPCVPKNEAGTATFTLTATNVPAGATIGIVGNFPDKNWAIEEPYEMTKGEGDVYTATVAVGAAQEYKYFLKLQDGAWSWDIGEDGGNRQMPVSLKAVDEVSVWKGVTDNNNNGNVTNYWTTNALVRLQLKGAVKTITQNEVTTEFNSQGQVIKITMPQTGEVIYSYNAEGALVNNGEYTIQYNNSGKYIPNFPFHINHAGLTPNLSAMIGESSRMDYVFVGDTLWMMGQYTSSTETTRDTTKIYYADKYPTNFVTDYSFMNATYQANGMFDVYIEGFYGEGYTSERKSTYKKDPQYLLMDKFEMTDTYVSGNSYSVTTYTYNEYKDMVLASETSGSDSYITEYYDYEYDEKGNWTSRKSHTKNNSEVWENERVETRVITYF